MTPHQTTFDCNENANAAFTAAPCSAFRCIVADPPWQIERIANMPRGKVQNPTVEVPYKTLSVEEISALPVREMADKTAHLYLWTINRFVEQSYGIARAWGFRPVQLLTWAKTPRGICLGTFTSSTEFVLFCRRGTLNANKRIDTTWWNWPRKKNHSQKPEEFQTLVESVSPGPYLELFARRKRLGWSAWGNEIACDVEMPNAALCRDSGSRGGAQNEQ